MNAADDPRSRSRPPSRQQNPQEQHIRTAADLLLPKPSSSSYTPAKLEKDCGDKEICHWNAAEEAVLVHALSREQMEGRQVENGFKPQAWRNVFEVGQRKGVRPKTIEQLKSRWQRLKKEYRIVKNLRHMQGFIWDEESAVVVAESILWENYLEKHPEAKPFRKKAFPLYDAIAGLVERDGDPATTPNGSINGSSMGWTQKLLHDDGSAFANTSPSGDGDDDEEDEFNSSDIRAWVDKRGDESMSEGEERRPIEVAHIMHDFKSQINNPMPKLRPIRPADFPATVVLPSINGMKRPSIDGHSPRRSPPTNGFLPPPATDEAATKRRRLDNPAAFCDNDATLRFPSYQQLPRPAHHLPQPRPMPPSSLFPSSSCIHHISQSLDNLVACLFEIPITPSNTSPLSSSYTNPRSHHTNSWYERKRHAWDTIVSEESLSEHELALARRVFRGNVELADEYLSFPENCRGARTLWLKREIRELAVRYEDR